MEVLRAQMRELEIRKRQLEESKSSSTSPVDQSPKASQSERYTERPSGSRNGVRVGSVVYGMYSLPFFIIHLFHFLRTTRPHLELPISIYANSMNSPPRMPTDTLDAGFLPPHQEVHFLALFWRTHYFSFPILNEGQVRREYQALVAGGSPEATRKPSPLIDIILALCIQLGKFHINRAGDSLAHNAGTPKSTYSSLDGIQYYIRCQEAIDQTIESPTIVTVQCYVLSTIYMYEAGFLNRALVVAGKAVGVAMLLGLPNEPPASDPEPEKEVSRRTWWSLFALDTMLSMEGGRMPMIGLSATACHLPSDSPEIAQWLAPHYRHDDACPSWLGFQTQMLRFLQAVRAVHSAFSCKYDDVVNDGHYAAFVNNDQAREECARFLTEPMKEIDAWARDVPQGYYVPRKEGKPFSTDSFVLDLDPNPNILVHCQCQRLLIELQYHHQCMCLYRPFICLAAPPDISTPMSDSKATTSLNHAMALTAMAYQALTTSEALYGVYRVFRWQKTALFTMLGYAYTFPLSHSMAAIRKTVEMGLAVIEMYINMIPDAAPTARIVRILADDMNAVTIGFLTNGSWSSSSSSWLTPLGTADLIVGASQTATKLSTTPVPSTSAASLTKSQDSQDISMQEVATTTTPPQASSAPAATDETFNFCQLDIESLPVISDLESQWDAMDTFWTNLDLAENPPTDP